MEPSFSSGSHAHLSTVFSFTPIGHIVSPYRNKFGVPRQSGLIQSAQVQLHLNPEFSAQSVRDLTGFSHVWLLFVFHETLHEGWNELVRPPKLGGKQKVGIFASRSPHRPNPIGLSLLKLERIETQPNVVLHLSGADLIDGTPVLDIKPYLPHWERLPEAAGGFTQTLAPLAVHWHENAQADVQRLGVPEAVCLLAQESMAQDPRPAYHNDAQRRYFMDLEAWQFQFVVQEDGVWVQAVQPLP